MIQEMMVYWLTCEDCDAESPMCPSKEMAIEQAVALRWEVNREDPDYLASWCPKHREHRD